PFQPFYAGAHCSTQLTQIFCQCIKPMDNRGNLLQGLQDARTWHYGSLTCSPSTSRVTRTSAATWSRATSSPSKASLSAVISASDTSAIASSDSWIISPRRGPEIMTASTEDAIGCTPLFMMYIPDCTDQGGG